MVRVFDNSGCQRERASRRKQECGREPPADTLGIRQGSLKDSVCATTPSSGLCRVMQMKHWPWAKKSKKVAKNSVIKMNNILASVQYMF